MKIFFYSLREYDELEYCRKFQKEFGIDFSYSKEYPSDNTIPLAEGCDAVSITPCDMSAPVLEKFYKIGVRHILCRSIGYDHVDLAKAKELKMRVSNVSYPPNGVANYAIMLILMCTRKIMHIMKRAELQDYSLQGKIGRDISTCTIGVVGTGRIGSTVIKHLSSFGCHILAYDPYPNKEAAQYAEYVNLDKLMTQADIITLHANATEDNYHMIDRESLKKMKDGVVIVNTSRGKLIDDEALIEAIESGKVAAAGLDVLENENGLYYYNRAGEAMNHRNLAILRSFPNVILSPHTAFYTQENVADMVKGCFESMQAFGTGKTASHEIVL